MKIHTSPFGKVVSLTLSFSLFLMSVPAGSIKIPSPVQAGEGKGGGKKANSLSLLSNAREGEGRGEGHKITSRPLTPKELKTRKGRATQGRNPFVAGQNKWDVIKNGVNLMSGNYSMSATDLSFEGGYGIPVNVTRSYSVNNPDEGPMGEGWTLSVDLRNTAGGLLKSSSAPVRSVPVIYKERPTLQADPELAVQPVEAVIATDAGGEETSIQRDADGVLTGPAWDKNLTKTEYELIQFNGSVYEVTRRIETTTPEGSVYVYEKKGSFVNGSKPWYDDAATSEPSNVLKITSVTDRYGNVTTYTYDETRYVRFTKSNGLVDERPLVAIEMPNGRRIDLTWDWTLKRITQASDGTRNVAYAYFTTGPKTGQLASVTTPAGRVTGYDYGGYTPTVSGPGTNPPSTSKLLKQITDPRGLSTQIGYCYNYVIQTDFQPLYLGASAYKVVHPNQTATYTYRVTNGGNYPPNSETPFTYESGYLGPSEYVTRDYVNGVYGQKIFEGSTLHSGALGPDGYLVYLAGSVLQVLPFDGYVLREYSYDSQDLLLERTSTHPTATNYGYGNIAETTFPVGRELLSSDTLFPKEVQTQTFYNFMGNPLRKITEEGQWNNVIYQVTNGPHTTVYAYHAADKYFQQKAVRDPSGRVSYTDYFTSTDPVVGRRGQVRRVFDPKHADFTGNSADPATFRSQIAPATNTVYSAEFEYDAKGRPTEVRKLKVKTGPTSGTYVTTKTTYGGDGAPYWGAATQVVEDFGGIGRTTTTNSYDYAGRATSVTDASGKSFSTSYNQDGQVLSVQRTDVPTPVVTYTYGTSGINNAMVLSVSDDLSGIFQAFTYQSAEGGGLGQVESIAEARPDGTAYTTGYTYNAAGDRETSTYTTPNGVTSWKYSHYIPVGDPVSPKRVFQTLTKLDALGAPTNEEFHYAYDSLGRMVNAAFAQTPQAGAYDRYYDLQGNPVPALRRARAFYKYDPAGRLLDIEHYWDTWEGSSYTSTPILGQHYTYDLVRNLRTQAQFYAGNAGSWELQRTETYGYDVLDQLTSANYGDGLPNQNVTWDYDAAGNRVSDSSQPGTWTYDNLNRMSASPGFSYTNDILGNRLTRGSTTYGWDILNRMTSFTSGSTSTYEYRADGLRTKKTRPSETMTYFYDGQMAVEEQVTGGTPSVTSYGIGGRGIDLIAKDGNISFPIYDGHGNMISTLARNGSSYTTANLRYYDAWGQIRQGATSGDPSQRYCANLGHKQDDESGLVYMRARYYEASTGRFVSEDPAMDDTNWYIYCRNDPVSLVDGSGRAPKLEFGEYWIRFDSSYTQEGTGKLLADMTWGRRGTGGLGSIRPDGSVKHKAAMPEALKKLILRDANTMKKVRARGGYGLGGGAMDSITATFMVDPIFVIETLIEAMGGIDNFHGMKIYDDGT